MDRLYNCDNQFYNFVGRKVNLRKYFEEFSSKLNIDDKDSPRDLLRKRGMDLDDQQLKFLEDACDTDKLTVKGEPLSVEEGSKPPELFPKVKAPIDLDLETFKREVRSKSRYPVPVKAQYTDTVIRKSNNRDLVPNKDFIVIVRIFPPSKDSGGKSDFSKVYTQEITLCNKNTLSTLRDCILCIEDYQECTGDVSEVYTSKDDFIPLAPRNKVLYLSGLFYIDNTFFIDRRRHDCIDYSEVIREWSKKLNIDLCDDPPKFMDNVEISDLSVRFGFPYLYQHQGKCEHLIVFSDARLIHPTKDTLYSQNYPIVINKKEQSNPCMACGFRISIWVVKDCKRYPHDTTFLCSDCHFSYNYNNRKKVDNFKAYRFWDRTEFLSKRTRSSITQTSV